MKRHLLPALACLALCGCGQSREDGGGRLKMMEQVDFSHVRIDDAFWSPRIEKHLTATLPICIDQIENQTGRIRNFENAARHEGAHSGIFFDDSDVYKAMEGIAYALTNHPDPALEAKADEWIDKFAAAQEDDGYINTYYTLTGLDNRWSDMDKHEMYCTGHLLEAGVAYLQATGKRKLLDVGIRMVEHIMSLFGPGKRHWVPGHEEIELALVKLYKVTGEEKYLDFANWLLEERGHGLGTGAGGERWNAVYYQDDKPIREMSEIAGHAVRAMYLYCGMADVAALKNDTSYINAMHRLWDNVVNRKMYITGGIGSSKHNEGFTADYDLPNLEAYCETCASVGMVFWNLRMNQFTGDAKYIDVLERSMYNGALAGVSLSGDRFFYVNPLESEGGHHRQAWYGCACCPSQISRFLPSIGSYIYATSENTVWVNLYMGSTATFQVDGRDISLTQATGYPWNGAVRLTVGGLDKPRRMEVRMRIPEWCKGRYTLTVNGQAVEAATSKGYAVISRRWADGDVVALTLDMNVEKVAADPRVKQDEGKRAIRRGPLVYCMEETDNKDSYDQALLSEETQFSTRFDPALLDGVQTIEAVTAGQHISLIPYYAWDNREAGKMKVWIDTKE